jgi:hypothetical protein
LRYIVTHPKVLRERGPDSASDTDIDEEIADNSDRSLGLRDLVVLGSEPNRPCRPVERGATSNPALDERPKEAVMRKVLLLAVAVVPLALSIGATPAGAAGASTGFGFVASDIAGFPTGEVALTGGGAFNPTAGSVHAGGSFSCVAQVDQVPLAGCLAGEGVRWDTETLLSTTPFKCTGAAGETLKTQTTTDQTVVLQSDFYRAGDGNEESFTAKMIVSAVDIAPDIPGIQDAWVQGVGCTDALVNLGH